jgi:hypothetical protein
MRSSCLMILALLCACPAASAVVESTSTPTPTEPAPTAEAPALTIEFLREHTRVLSADELGGRLPGSEGARKTVEYIVTNMQTLGLEPGGENGTWTQTVRMRGVTVDQAATSLELRGRKGPAMPMTFGETWVGSSFSAGSEHVLDAELVFLGYGITAPEQQWDDYAKLDVKGKIVVVFVGDPPLDDGRFGGKAMTYYGRWGYKYEAALAAGAAGCLVIHEEAPASYGWNVPKTSFSSERFTVLGADGKAAPALGMQGWISMQTAEEIAKRSGKSLAKWHELALQPNFRPFALELRAQGKIVTTEKIVEDVNVLGRLPGAGQPEQTVMLTAHWDHLGTNATLEAAGEDGIHNGAIDNASGIATMLGVAAELRREPPLDRSVVFLATTAEEQGLLGSRYWVANPTVPHQSVVAVINLEQHERVRPHQEGRGRGLRSDHARRHPGGARHRARSQRRGRLAPRVGRVLSLGSLPVRASRDPGAVLSLGPRHGRGRARCRRAAAHRRQAALPHACRRVRRELELRGRAGRRATDRRRGAGRRQAGRNSELQARQRVRQPALIPGR